MEEGIVPEIWFLCKSNSCKLTKFKISSGISPTKLLFSRLTEITLSSFNLTPCQVEIGDAKSHFTFQ